MLSSNLQLKLSTKFQVIDHPDVFCPHLQLNRTVSGEIINVVN